MTRTIVVPLLSPRFDPERVSEAALPFARALVARTGADVHLVSVVPPPPDTFFTLEPNRTPPEELHEQHLAEAVEFLDRMAYTFDRRDRVKTAAWEGSGTTELAELVGTLDDPLIVMARQRVGGLGTMLYGNAVARLLQSAGCPILVVRGPAGEDGSEGSATLRRVLVPLDGSPLSSCALDALGALGPSDLELHLLYVIEDLPRLAEFTEESLTEIIRPGAERYLRAMADRLVESGYGVTIEVRGGEADEEIATAAAERRVDLIAMATHGRGGFSRLLLGSVAEKVLKQATVPLFLVRPDEAAIAAAASRRIQWMQHAAEAEDAEGGPLARPVAEIMTTPAIVTEMSTPQVDVLALMLNHRIGAVPVVDAEGKLQGIITETDLAGSTTVPLGTFQAARLAGAGDEEAAAAIRESGRRLTASHMMRSPVITADERESIKHVIDRMVAADISHMPVVRDGVPVGMVSRRDLMRLLMPEN